MVAVNRLSKTFVQNFYFTCATLQKNILLVQHFSDYFLFLLQTWYTSIMKP